MKVTKTVVLLTAAVLVAQLAAAQTTSSRHHSTNSGGMMGGGSTGGGMNGNNGTGSGMGGAYGLMGGAMGQALTVGSDGVAYTLRSTSPSGTTTPAIEVVAIRPSGTVAWSANVDGGMTRVKLSGNLLLIANGGEGIGMQNGTTSNDHETSQLVALSTASGSVQWTLALDGFASTLEPFSGGTYVTVIKGDFSNMNGANGGMNGTTGTPNNMTRTLVAVSTDGKVLWSVSLS